MFRDTSREVTGESRSDVEVAVGNSPLLSTLLKACDRAITEQPEWIEAYCRRMESIAPDNELERAGASCARLLRLVENGAGVSETAEVSAQIYRSLARVQFEAGWYPQAGQFYRKAFVLSPQPAIAEELQACAVKQRKLQQRWEGFANSRADRVNAGLPQGVYGTTHDWWQASGLDGSHYRVVSGMSEVSVREPAPPMAPDFTTPQCRGINCIRCLGRLDRQLTFSALNSTIDPEWEQFVAIVPGGRVWTMPQQSWWQSCEAMAIVSADGYLLADLSREYPGWLPGCDRHNRAQHRIFRTEALPPVEKIEGTVAIMTGLSPDVYFHWMVDILPRWDILRRGGFEFDRIDWFYVNQYQKPFQRETLTRLGIPASKIIEGDRAPHIQADRLIVPSFAGPIGWLMDSALTFLRNRFSIATPMPDSPKRIYISRDRARYRHLLNEGEVMAQLRQWGFESVALELMSLEEQIACVANAAAIVAPHGSGLTNLIFCDRAKTKVLEIVSPHYIRYYFQIIARKIDLKIHRISGNVVTNLTLKNLMYPNSLIEDILIDVKSLTCCQTQM